MVFDTGTRGCSIRIYNGRVSGIASMRINTLYDYECPEGRMRRTRGDTHPQNAAHQTGETGCGVVESGAGVPEVLSCHRSLKRPLAAAKSVPRF